MLCQVQQREVEFPAEIAAVFMTGRLRATSTQSQFANHGCVLILVAMMMPQTGGKINVSSEKVEKEF